LVRTLVRLRFRLARNARRRLGTASQIGFVLASTFAVLGAVLMFVVGLSAVTSGGLATRATAILGAAGLFVGWTLLPVVWFGNDETLDPARLVLLPLRPRPLLMGLTIGAFVGPAPVVATAAVLGVVAGLAGSIGFVVVVLAGVLLLALCVVASRCLTTTLAAALSSRRGRDAAVIVGALLAVGFQLVRFLPRWFDVSESAVARVCDVVRWTPPGMIGQAMLDANHGRVLVGLVELAPAALLLVLLARGWAVALDRALTRAPSSGAPRRRRRDAESEGVAELALVPRLLRGIPVRPWVAVASRELRYVARDPTRKVMAFQAAAVGLIGPVALAVTQASDQPRVVALASAGAYIAVLGAMNQFGFDGPAMWQDVAAGDRVRAALIGKNVALAMLTAPAVLLAAVVLAAVTDGWADIPLALLLAAGQLGAGLAVANVASVRFPMALAETNNPFGRRVAGQGCATMLIGMACTTVQALLVAPIAVATFVAARAGYTPLAVVALIGLAYGAVLWWFGVQVAANVAGPRLPELLREVDPRKT
jgi:ABC-2 type transport system permease protein